MKRIALVFDQRIKSGTAECFFHLMWGYLLPSIHLIRAIPDVKNCQFIFNSCGPVMDELIREVMQLFQYNFEIVPAKNYLTGTALRLVKEIKRRFFPRYGLNRNSDSWMWVPRWDTFLLRPLLLGQETDAGIPRISVLQKELRRYPAVLNLLKQKEFVQDLSSAFFQVKAAIEERMAPPLPHSEISRYADSYLILSRSPTPKFYSRSQGKAEHPGYGLSRRSLSGIEEARSELRENGIPVEVFEPGRFRLEDQINVFRSCKGIIGILGSELANVIWLQPKSRVIVIRPSSMNHPPLVKYLCGMFNHHYIEIVTDQGNFPRLCPELVKQHLAQ